MPIYNLQKQRDRNKYAKGTAKKVAPKFIFIELEERNGEQEYRQFVVREIGGRVRKFESIADKICKEWYASYKPEKADGGYYHLGGTIHVSVTHIREITKAEYDVLTKFI